MPTLVLEYTGPTEDYSKLKTLVLNQFKPDHIKITKTNKSITFKLGVNRETRLNYMTEVELKLETYTLKIIGKKRRVFKKEDRAVTGLDKILGSFVVVTFRPVNTSYINRDGEANPDFKHENVNINKAVSRIYRHKLYKVSIGFYNQRLEYCNYQSFDADILSIQRKFEKTYATIEVKHELAAYKLKLLTSTIITDTSYYDENINDPNLKETDTIAATIYLHLSYPPEYYIYVNSVNYERCPCFFHPQHNYQRGLALHSPVIKLQFMQDKSLMRSYFSSLRTTFNLNNGKRVIDVRPQFEFDGNTKCLDLFKKLEKIKPMLGFEIFYLLNSLVCNKVCKYYEITLEFMEFLYKLIEDIRPYCQVESSESKATCSTYVIATLEYLFLNPRDTSKPLQEIVVNSLKALNYKYNEEELPNEFKAKMRKLIITPTYIHYEPIKYETTNRILRKFGTNKNRYFVRVQYMLDDMQRGLTSISNIQKEAIVSKLVNGFSFCFMPFKYLGFSNSQKRSFSFWMLHESKSENLSLDHIFHSIGDIKEKNVSKFAARYAQCFTTSIPITLDKNNADKTKAGINDYEVKEKDVERTVILPDKKEPSTFNFSDGVGKITFVYINELLRAFYKNDPDKLKEIEENIKTNKVGASAIQCRYKGCKGVFSAFDAEGYKIFVRPSQRKFESKDSQMEIVKISDFYYGHLNRQVIMLLLARNVTEKKIQEIHDEYLQSIKGMFDKENKEESRKVLQSNIFPFIYSIIEDMISVGYDFKDASKSEPFLYNLVKTIYSNSLRELKKRTRILINKSVSLLGIMDEYGILEDGQVFCQYRENNQMKQVVGSAFVSKNPCLYPEDIRVVDAVEAKEGSKLLCYFNVVVFPQKGKRPIPNETSGSDLDGDVYFLTWDERIIPTNKVEAAPFPDSSNAIKKDVVMIRDIIEDFVGYHQVNCLGTIANCHMVLSDQEGAGSENCKALAAEHSKEVDSAKTGVHGYVKKELKAKMKSYPDYMENKENPSYVSKHIIGTLYRSIKSEEIVKATITTNIDNLKDPLFLIDLSKDISTSIKEKVEKQYQFYSADIKTIMNNFGISEYEVISGSLSEIKTTVLMVKDTTEASEQIQSEVQRVRQKYKKVFNLFPLSKGIIAKAYYTVAYKANGMLSFPWLIAEKELITIKREFKNVF